MALGSPNPEPSRAIPVIPHPGLDLNAVRQKVEYGPPRGGLKGLGSCNAIFDGDQQQVWIDDDCCQKKDDTDDTV